LFNLIDEGILKFVFGKVNKLYCKPHNDLTSLYKAADGFNCDLIEFFKTSTFDNKI
jgi:hypothetical protein